MTGTDARRRAIRSAPAARPSGVPRAPRASGVPPAAPVRGGSKLGLFVEGGTGTIAGQSSGEYTPIYVSRSSLRNIPSPLPPITHSASRQPSAAPSAKLTSGASA